MRATPGHPEEPGGEWWRDDPSLPRIIECGPAGLETGWIVFTGRGLPDPRAIWRAMRAGRAWRSNREAVAALETCRRRQEQTGEDRG